MLGVGRWAPLRLPSVVAMRSRPSPEHQEAVARRLALLSAELAAARPAADGTPGAPGEDADEWTAPHTRIREPERVEPPRPELPDPEPSADPVAAVPVPGRHASRRPRPGLAAVLPATLRGRVWLGAPQVAVLAVLVAAGLAVACWWVVRGGAEAVVAPVVPTPAAGLVSPAGVPSSDDSPGAVTPALASAGAVAGGSVTVDVAGRVRHPGIAVLDAGSRVVDALAAAGGARPGADLSGLNLARVLVDGEQVVVGIPAPAGQVASAASSPGAPAGPLVNLNTATQPQLEELPEVGPVTAQAILGWRSEHGGFTSVDELLEVDGIGDATLDQLAPYVTV